MSPIDLLRTLRGLLSRPGRALLTLLGIVIGAGSIVLVAALVRGGQDALIRANQGITDSDLVVVDDKKPPDKELWKTRRFLSARDAAAVGASRTVSGSQVGSEAQRRTHARLDGREKRVTLVSADPGSPERYRIEVAAGRFLDAKDLAARRRVCVVGYEVWTELLQRRSIRDRQVVLRIDDEAWTVIGVLRDKPILGATDGTHIWNRKVIVPETTFRAIYSPEARVQRIFVRAPASRRPKDVRAAVGALLFRRHLGVATYEVEDPEKRSNEQMILAVIKALLVGSGLIALFVGGINVMNVMLVNVTERRAEIGLRRSVGAPRSTILAQFLLESGVLAALGGLIGVLGGALTALGASYLFESWLGRWSFAIEPWSIALALGASLATGITFGALPAARAARVDPIEALRSS